MLFGHGDDFYDIAQHIKINYSSNVWYGAELTPLKNHIYQTFEQISRYPEPDAASLRQTLAEAHGISPDNLLVTNGSITAFYLIADAWQGAKSTILIPSFAEYEDACRLHRPMFGKPDGYLSGTGEEAPDIHQYLWQEACRFGLSFPLHV